MELKQYLSVKDICDRLAVGKSLVYRLIDDGILPAARLGGRILICVDDLVNLLEPVKPPKPELAPLIRERKKRGQKGSVEPW